MKNDRDVEKMVSQMGLKRAPKQAVIQYGKGMLQGMHMAYLAVARKMLGEGGNEEAVRQLLKGLVDEKELAALLKEAAE